MVDWKYHWAQTDYKSDVDGCDTLQRPKSRSKGLLGSNGLSGITCRGCSQGCLCKWVISIDCNRVHGAIWTYLCIKVDHLSTLVDFPWP